MAVTPGHLWEAFCQAGLHGCPTVSFYQSYYYEATWVNIATVHLSLQVKIFV